MICLWRVQVILCRCSLWTVNERRLDIVISSSTNKKRRMTAMNHLQYFENSFRFQMMCACLHVCMFILFGSSPTSVVPEGKLIIGAERQ